MTDFTKPIAGFRYVATQRGDTIQRVALRELGDATSWAKLVWFNDLIYPYLTDDPADVTSGVLLTGSIIKVPASTATSQADTEPDDVFGTDVLLKNGRLSFSKGNIKTVTGQENLRQALSNRIETEQKELMFHPTYGMRVRQLIGRTAGPTTELVAAQFIRQGLALEDRVKTINKVSTAVNGDVLSVAAEIQPISGVVIKLNQDL